jgi:ectoine hydroxylase-related dioxygenase (phytanoyl-CoA dioxygenase family)
MLTAEQREQYRRSGFVNGGPVLDEAAVETLQQEVLRVIDDRNKAEAPQPVLLRNLSPDEAHPIWQIVNIWEASPAFRALVNDRRLAEMAATLSGAKSLRIWHDQVQYKPKALGGRLGWHQDSPLWPSIQPKDAQITAWVALDDADADNGCMYMVPGSHRWGDRRPYFETLPEGGLLPETFEGHPVHIVMCPVKRGHVHFHHPLTWHGSGTNHSNRPRRAIGIHYMTENTVYDAKGDHLMARFVTAPDGAPMEGEKFLQVWG